MDRSDRLGHDGSFRSRSCTTWVFFDRRPDYIVWLRLRLDNRLSVDWWRMIHRRCYVGLIVSRLSRLASAHWWRAVDTSGRTALCRRIDNFFSCIAETMRHLVSVNRNLLRSSRPGRWRPLVIGRVHRSWLSDRRLTHVRSTSSVGLRLLHSMTTSLAWVLLLLCLSNSNSFLLVREEGCLHASALEYLRVRFEKSIFSNRNIRCRLP